MGDIQAVTVYYRVVYTLVALIFGGYSVAIALAARRAQARLEASKNDS